MFEKRLVIVVVLLSIIPAAASPQNTVTIDLPHDLAEVPWRACVSGTASDENAQLVAVVHPTEVSTYWIQPAISVRPHGRFELPLYIGESSPGQHAGKTFEIRVFSNPNQKDLKEGTTLPWWPAAQGASAVVRVIRNDSAPSGCAKGATGIGSIEPVPTSVSFDSNSNRPAPMESTPPASSRLDFGVGVGCLAFGLFLALLIIVERTGPAAHRLATWLARFKEWLVLVALKMAASVCWLWNWLRDTARRHVRPVWAARGFSGNLRDFSVSALLAPMLLIASAYAFYAEGRTIVQALNPLFGVEEAQDSSGADGVLHENVPERQEVSVVSDQTKSNDNKVVHLVVKEMMLFVESFERLREEKLGFLAIALAGLEGAFGVVLLWRMGAERPLALRPIALLLGRPVLTVCFLVMNISLGVLAAYRGYELSPSTMNWIMPTVVSAGIAAVMPWILTFTLHYCLECSADFLGVTGSVLAVTTVYIGVCFMAILWSLLSMAIVASVACAFACFFLFCVASWAVLLSAQALGEAVRKLRREVWPDMRIPLPVQAASASFAALFLLFGSYYIIRGLVQ